jgi:hypothetical protein
LHADRTHGVYCNQGNGVRVAEPRQAMRRSPRAVRASGESSTRS